MFDLEQHFSILPQPHNTMMDQYLQERMEDAFAALAWPTSRDDWERERPEIRKRLLGSLGYPEGLPTERAPVRVVERGVLMRAGYRIERLLLETRPGWWVPAHAYVPERTSNRSGAASTESGYERFPAVLCPHGHWETAKASLHVQARCAQLARMGYVALAVDMAGYGERRSTGHRETTYLWASGMTLSGIQLWDNVRALDYLCARSDVDRERLGCTGASGGGNQTMILSAVDERVKAAVPVCSVENFRSYFEKGFCECETYPGVLALADHPHILALIAPRALCIVNGTLDTGFPVNRARRTYRRLHALYEWFDPARVEYFEFYGPHSYERTAREAAYRWFAKWLSPAPFQESPLVLEPPQGPPLNHNDDLEDLAPTDVGAAAHGAPGLTIAALHRVAAEEWVAKARRTPWDQKAFEACILGAFGESFPAPAPRLHALTSETTSDGIRIERQVLEPESGILLPLLVLRREVGESVRNELRYAPASNWLIVLTPQEKKSLHLRRDLRLALEEGWTVAVLDVRATGETTPPGGGPWIGQRCAMLGLSLIGMQSWDISAAVSHAQATVATSAAANHSAPVEPGSVWLYAEGAYALTGLLGAVLDERLSGIGLAGLPASLAVEGAAGQPRGALPFGFLRFGDVVDLAARLTPRRLVVGGLVDANGRPLQPEAERLAFSLEGRDYAEGQFSFGSKEEGVLSALLDLNPTGASAVG